MKLSTKDVTELSEHKSSFIMSTLADSFSCSIRCLASFADTMFRTAMITWTFRSANTRVVSNPIPLAPPEWDNTSQQIYLILMLDRTEPLFLNKVYFFQHFEVIINKETILCHVIHQYRTLKVLYHTNTRCVFDIIYEHQSKLT